MSFWSSSLDHAPLLVPCLSQQGLLIAVEQRQGERKRCQDLRCLRRIVAGDYIVGVEDGQELVAIRAGGLRAKS